MTTAVPEAPITESRTADEGNISKILRIGVAVSASLQIGQDVSSAGAPPIWLTKVLQSRQRKHVQTEAEGMVMLTQAITTTAKPMTGLERVSALGVNKDQDLIAHIAIPPPHRDIQTAQPVDFQIREVILGKPTRHTAKAMTTLGLKHIFSQLDEGEEEIQFLRKQNEVLTGYIKEVVGPIDPADPEKALQAALEKQAPAPLPLD